MPLKMSKYSFHIDLCTYNPNDHKRDKKLLCLDNGFIASSCAEMSRLSTEIFKTLLNSQSISRVCLGGRNTYRGYTFKYIEDLTLEEYIKYDIENKLKELHNQELVQAC